MPISSKIIEVYLIRMAYKYRSRRAVKRLKRKSKRNFLITLVILGLLIYVTINWILPYFIGGIGIVKNVIEPSKQNIKSDKSLSAPPVLNIPFEATNSSIINIKGYSTPNSKVKLYIDDEVKQTVDVSSDGSFNFENVSLSLGTNNIYGKTVDDKGNESLPSKTIRLTYTKEKPSLTVNQPEDGKKIQGGEKKVTVSGKTDAGVKIYINDSQTIVDKDGNFNTEIPLNDGENTITVKALDPAGNFNDLQRSVIYNP